MRVSIVATSLDGITPEEKSVISMVHRQHNRNVGYSNNLTSTLATNQATLNATEGATALDINTVVDKNTVAQQRSEQEEIKKEPVIDPTYGNISMENAAYLQEMEDTASAKDMSTFEIDSIELVTPKLFSDNEEDNSFNQDNNDKKNEPKIFESSESREETEIKEPEMFEENNQEEDFEIPAYLRRQKN